jgi:hypothetical protein
METETREVEAAHRQVAAARKAQAEPTAGAE